MPLSLFTSTLPLTATFYTTSMQRDLARANAMLSAVPCIATLIELQELPPNDSPGAEQGAPLAAGRVLLQNELSLVYWGKLNKAESGELFFLMLMSLAKTLILPDHPKSSGCDVPDHPSRYRYGLHFACIPLQGHGIC